MGMRLILKRGHVSQSQSNTLRYRRDQETKSPDKRLPWIGQSRQGFWNPELGEIEQERATDERRCNFVDRWPLIETIIKPR